MGRKKARYAVFLDFDNTITLYDTLDDIIARYSEGGEWKELERRWVAGEIGSRECLDGQMRGLRVTRGELARYVKTVKLDPGFKKILRLCGSRKIEKFILSDNFEFILKGILRAKGIRGLRVYCNALSFKGDRIVPRFPFLNEACHKCAHCKKGNLIARTGAHAATVYVGDGLSDICPAEEADIVFAKGSLAKHFTKKGLRFIPFERLDDVYKYLKRSTA